MGMKNMRAICPNCGGKIHTQPKGFIGSVALGANGWMVKTGTTCEHCGVKLTGKVTFQNYAVLDVPAAESNGSRCHVLAAGRQCTRTEGHPGKHYVSKS